jgi:hypothetical protein
MRTKRMMYSLVRMCALLVAVTCQAATIRYAVINLPSAMDGPGVQRYTYTVTDVMFHAWQELDIVFDPAIFGGISNGIAGPGFDVMLFQPNDPPGTLGHYSAMALADNPSLDLFSVDFVFAGPGEPGSQQFVINQYDESGSFVRTVESGFTTVPEPDNFTIGTLILIVSAIWRAVSRRKAATA